MKLIIISSSLILACFALAAGDTIKNERDLNIFGRFFEIPDGYSKVFPGSKSSIIYYLFSPTVEVGAESTIGSILYSKVDECEFCDFNKSNKGFNLISKCIDGEYTIAELLTNEFRQVRLFLIKDKHNVLIVGEDKVLFDSWLSKLELSGCEVSK